MTYATASGTERQSLMSLVIALALLIAFTWFISRRDASGDPGWVTMTSPRSERIALRGTDGRRR